MPQDFMATALPAAAFATLCTLVAWRRTAWYSPATMWSGFCTGGIATLWIVVATGTHLPAAGLSPMPTIQLGDHLGPTVGFFAIQALIGPLSVPGRGAPRAGERGAAALRAALARARAGPPARLYALGAFAVCAVHLALIDRDAFLLNSEYLLLTNPARNGVGEGLGSFVNNIVRPLALPAFLLLAIRDAPAAGAGAGSGRSRGPDLQSLLLALVCAYAFAFSLAVYSRYLMVYVFVFFMGRVFSRGSGGAGASLSFAAYTAVILACFVLALAGRGNATQGLASVSAVVGAIDPSQLGWLAAKLGATSFDAGTSFANSLRYGPVYDAVYQALSFSPLPSFLDGFDAHAMEQRINVYVPFSAFGEVVHFHWLAAPALFLACWAATRQLTLGFFRDGDPLAAALFPVFLVALLKLQTYPVRASFRIVLAIALLAWISGRLRRRGQAMAEAAAPAAAPPGGAAPSAT